MGSWFYSRIQIDAHINFLEGQWAWPKRIIRLLKHFLMLPIAKVPFEIYRWQSREGIGSPVRAGNILFWNQGLPDHNTMKDFGYRSIRFLIRAYDGHFGPMPIQRALELAGIDEKAPSFSGFWRPGQGRKWGKPTGALKECGYVASCVILSPMIACEDQLNGLPQKLKVCGLSGESPQFQNASGSRKWPRLFQKTFIDNGELTLRVCGSFFLVFRNDSPKSIERFKFLEDSVWVLPILGFVPDAINSFDRLAWSKGIRERCWHLMRDLPATDPLALGQLNFFYRSLSGFGWKILDAKGF